MSNPADELAELIRDARAHATWLRDAGEERVLRDRQAVALQRPPQAPSNQVRPARPPTAPAPIAKPAPVAQRPLAPPAPVAPPSGDPVARLAQIRADLGDCKRCKLCQKRKNLVFGVGNPRAELVFVGEGPGENEDLQGEPFVGAAGQLLDKMIEAMGLSRQQVYICNVVKCRPPGNRNPEPDEIEQCEPFLLQQLDAIRPKVVVALGKFAAQTLLRDPTSITRMRGQWRAYRGMKLMPTFHPSYLLRSPSEKRKAWDDLQLVMKELGLERPKK
ncbi:MAG: uracil-DNA glycosylase [Deltaproteobacteria bacterium]|nr:uracil-DNA glycosylase [Deltaproteobacteria bacterium]